MSNSQVQSSKVGYIPSQWKFAKLEEISSKVGSGITPRGGSKTYLDEGVPLIRSQNVLVGKLDISDVAFISDDQHEEMKGTHLQPYDVLLNISGASIGRCCFVPPYVKAGNVNQHVCIIRPTHKINPYYLSSMLNSEIGQKQIGQFQAGGNRQGLNFQQIRSFTIPLPPLNEQQKIAQILSTWDEAIAKTEKLIAALEQRKKGLMQRLLTGEVRFSGFEEEWKTYELQDGVNIRLSNVDKKVNPEEITVKLCNFLDVFNNQFIDSSIDFMNGSASTNETEKFSLLINDVIITKDSETPEDIAESAVVIEELDGVVCGYHLAILRPKPYLVDGIFLMYLLHEESVHNHFYKLANGATRFGLTLGSIEKAAIKIPNIDEQRKISEILLVSDNEIKLIRQYLRILQNQKKGLMQRLLTGQVRVKVEE